MVNKTETEQVESRRLLIKQVAVPVASSRRTDGMDNGGDSTRVS
jgi:hypothetical protein